MASPFDDVQHFLSFRVELNTIYLAAAEFLITPPSKCHDKIGQFLHNCFNICPLKRKPVGYIDPCLYHHTECEAYRWGQDCRERCSNRCQDVDCDHVTGYCVCLLGYGGERCDQGRFKCHECVMSSSQNSREVCDFYRE